MKKIKRCLSLFLCTAILINALLSPITAYAVTYVSGVSWNNTQTVWQDGSYYHQIDIANYGRNWSTYTWYQNEGWYYDSQVFNMHSSRIYYDRKIQVSYGMKINITGTTADYGSGGSDITGNGKLYYNVLEWNASGNLLYDGGWTDITYEYVCGVSEPPSTCGAMGPQSRGEVAYITIIFRLASGDYSVNSPSPDISPRGLANEYPNLFIVFKPFTYTINNQGVVSTVQRTGVASVWNPLWNPSKWGYTFTGWQVSSNNWTGGNNWMNGNTYSTEQLNAWMQDGRFYTSLFGDVTFTAQFVPNTYAVRVNPNGGVYNNTYDITTHYITQDGDAAYISNPWRYGFEFNGWWWSGTSQVYSYMNGHSIWNSVSHTANYTRTVLSEGNGTYTKYRWEGITSGQNAWNCITFPGYWVNQNETITISGYIRANSVPTAINFYHGASQNDYMNCLYSVYAPTDGWQYFEFSRTFPTATNAFFEVYTGDFYGLNNATLDFDLKGIQIRRDNGTVLDSWVYSEGSDMELTAQWEPNTYAIRYFGNGATGGNTEPSYHTYNGPWVKLSKNGFSRTGYTFRGWSVDEGQWSYWLQGSYYNFNTFNPAFYANAHSDLLNAIGFNADGLLSHYLNYGRFEGRSAVGDISDDSSLFPDEASVLNLTHENLTHDVNRGLSFFAQWRPNVHTLAYDANGGIGTPISQSVTTDDGSRVSTTVPQREGYTFKYWTTTPYDTDDKIGVVLYNSNPDAYIKKFLITYIDDSIVEILVDAPYANSVSVPTWTSLNGQDDLVWHPMWPGYWEKAGETFNFGCQITISDHNGEVGEYNHHVYAYDSNGTMLDWAAFANRGFTYNPGDAYVGCMNGDMQMLYAQWNPNIYTITLDNQGAEIAGTGNLYQKYDTGIYAASDCDKTISSITVPTKTGYGFCGYYTQPNGGGEQCIDSSGSIVCSDRTFTSNITLYACWVKNSYTLSYDPNEGIGSIIREPYLYGASYTVKSANTFIRPGYTFIGWNDRADGSGTSYMAESSKTWTVAGNINLYAQWKPNIYTITLDCQGATTVGPTHFYTKYNTGIYATLDCSTAISSIEIPTKTGYRFGGYYTEQNGQGEQYIDASGSIVCDDITFLQDTALYAHWIVNSCSILYDANGGTGTMESTLAIYGTSVTLLPNKFIRTGYVFKGWSTNANGAVEYTDKQTIDNFSIDGSNLKLYAVWEANVYWVSLDAQDAEMPGTISYYVKYNEGNYTTADCTTKLSGITNPQRTGYTFRGYYTEKNGTGTQYIDSTGKILTETISFTEDTTLYAHWTRNTYTIQYHANGGTGSMADTIVIYGTSITLSANAFINTGYTFKGWAVSSTGNVVYTDKESVMNLTEENGVSINLYAVWDANSYKVIFDTNGGIDSEISKIYKYGDVVDLSIIAEKPGYRFVGWSPLKNARIPLPSYVMKDKNVTLYAVYTIPVSDVENHDYPSYSKTEAISEDEVFLRVWIKGNPAIVKEYPLTYKEDINPMIYQYELPPTDINFFVNGREFYYQLIAYDNAGNYAVLHEGGSSGETKIPESEEIPKPLAKYLQTVKHYKYKAITDTWEWFATTTENVKEGEVFYPSYVTPPIGYYTSDKDNGSTVTGLNTYNAYYRPYAYTLTFHARGGSCDTPSKTVTYGGYYGTLPTPERPGYIFTEWNADENGTGEKVSSSNIYGITSDSMIYAQWKPNVYRISLNGSGAETAGTKVYYEQYNTDNYTDFDCTTIISTITPPTKTGYMFKGYFTETDGNGMRYIDETGRIIAKNTAFLEDTTLYAHWEANRYTITFHANGGMGTMECLNPSYGEVVNLSSNTFEKAGYRFIGWAISEKGSVMYEDRQEVSNLTSVNNDTISLYAVWKPNVYIVKLDSQGADNAGTMSYYQKYETGNYITADCIETISTITKPAKAGYAFDGYYTDKDGTGTQYIDSSGKILSTNKTFTSDIILYANWKVNAYTVKFNANGGTGTMEDSIIKYDEIVKLNSNIFENTGHTFAGWSTTARGNVEYTDKMVVKNLTAENGKTITLYAVWKPNVYTIKLDSDEGDTLGTAAYYEKYGIGNYTTVECTQIISSITKPTKTGYTFEGYYTGKDGTGVQYIDENGKILSTKATFTDDITLYAKWGPNKYIFKYNANGGIGSIEDTSAIYGEFVTLRTNTFTRTGYEFIGWATSQDGAVLYENSAMIKNVTSVNNDIIQLYAVWEPIVYKIILDNQDATTKGTEVYYQKYDTGRYSDINCTTAITNISNPGLIGYIFNGYYTGKNGTGIQYIDASGKILSTNKTFTEHTTLYACWTPVTYTIKFDANGGTGTMGETTAIYDIAVVLSAALFQKTGHTFMGWSKTQNGSVDYQDKAEVNNLVAVNGGSITLYAVWNINSYTVTYDYRTNGGNHVSADSLSFHYGTKIDLSVTAKKDQYSLVGWNTDSSATTALSSLTMGTEPVTLYAIYKKDITVTFVEYGNAGVVTTTSSKTVYNNVMDADFPVNETTTWTRWENIGWTPDKDAMAESRVSSGAVYTTDKDVTLYARYRSEVELCYDTNGSTMILDSKKKERYYNASGHSTYPSYVVASAPVLSKHSFVNWKVESGCVLDINGNQIAFTVPNADICVAEDSLLQAVWDKHPVIEAYNRYFTLEEAKSGIITQEKLLEKVIAMDEEAKTASNPDGILRNGIDVIVKNYNASDFTQVTGDKEINVIYQATDSFGNVVTKTVTVTITDTTMQKSSKKAYVRFISAPYFMDEDGTLLSPDKGGVEETSIWRKNINYCELLKETLIRANAGIDKKGETWIFSYKVRKDVKEYTYTYGHVRNAIEKFFELFGQCKYS